MNGLKTIDFFVVNVCELENEVSKARPLLKSRETERAAKNIYGQKKKPCNGSSLAVVR
jgi:hypothetical protein